LNLRLTVGHDSAAQVGQNSLGAAHDAPETK
jgi:hypothetical protein